MSNRALNGPCTMPSTSIRIITVGRRNLNSCKVLTIKHASYDWNNQELGFLFKSESLTFLFLFEQEFSFCFIKSIRSFKTFICWSTSATRAVSCPSLSSRWVLAGPWLSFLCCSFDLFAFRFFSFCWRSLFWFSFWLLSILVRLGLSSH